MPRGGKRVNSGRKKKPLAEKLLDGNPGRKPLQVMEFPDGTQMIGELVAPEFLADAVKNSEKWPSADKIFNNIAMWLERTGCLAMIAPDLITDYSLLKARWLECEAMIMNHGLLARHPITKQPIATPFVRMGIDYLKAADVAWSRIWDVVAQNSLKDFNGISPNDDVMERLLTMKRP